MTIPAADPQAARCWVLWKDLALSIPNSAGAPYPIQYCANVARQGFGTWAQESKFRYERQLGFSDNPDINDCGAWGLGQCERGSITESVILTKQKPKLLAAINAFLARYHEPALDTWAGMIPELLRLLATPGPKGDATAAVLTRLHYMYRTETSIPNTLEAQAAYYKHWFNTDAGAATPGEYIHNYLALCQPVIDLDKTPYFTQWAA